MADQDYVYLSERLSLPIKQLVVNNPIAHAIYRVAQSEKWAPDRFLEELAIALAKAHAELCEKELQRRMSNENPSFYEPIDIHWSKNAHETRQSAKQAAKRYGSDSQELGCLEFWNHPDEDKYTLDDGEPL